MTSDGERLTLDGADGTHVILLDDDGRRFRLEVDDELRDAVRRSRPAASSSSTAGPEEAGMDTGPNTELRPRDIQARVRAGATAEEIAEVTGATVEKVLVYARPVLAERAHMAQRAQRSSVRRPGGDGSSGHRTLGDAVAKRLRAIDEDPGTVEWDSRKREDGRWVLTASYATEERGGLARFTFDPPGNFVTVDDGDARWLLGDDPEPVGPPEPAAAVAGEGADAASGPRLVAVADDELPLGGDALRLVDEPADAGSPYSTYTVEADLPAAETGPTGADADATETAEQAAVPEDTEDTEDTGNADDTEDPDGPDDEPPSRRRARKRGGRASVPSWDEIMFGGRRE